jgi:transcription antitermination factor NusG
MRPPQTVEAAGPNGGKSTKQRAAMDNSPYWTVAVAQSNREDLVKTLLTREGFEVYWPRIREQKRAASLFPGYLMVRVVVRWYPIRWCPGVLKLLMAGDSPAKLADHVVNEIKGREVRGFVKLPKPPRLQEGQPVRVTTGSFAGHAAIYAGMSGSARERVLLNLLGQSVTVSLPIGNVEAITRLKTFYDAELKKNAT